MTLLILASILSAKAQDNTSESFKVWGNCGMCKRTIESAALNVKGVKSADWNMEDDMITVVFNPKKVGLDKIKTSIAASGYDTDTHRAPNNAYDKLHGCCKYERPQPN